MLFVFRFVAFILSFFNYFGERGGSVVERQTPEGEVGGLKPTSTMLCP